MQMLERQIVPSTSRLQLIGRRGGASENALWGVRSDLRDAFDDWAPTIDLGFGPEEVDADIVVMLAGASVSNDPGVSVDREGLARGNADIFEAYAHALAASEREPLVIVQSNPVELAVGIFAEHLHPQRVIGTGAWSDTLRFAREIASDLGVSRRDVFAHMLGTHGDNLVPLWSAVDVRGLSRDEVEGYIERTRGGHSLAELPDRIRAARAEMLEMVRSGRIAEAYGYVSNLPADLRAAVKPFFTHFTALRTTEAVTARAAADLVEAFIEGSSLAVPAQVQLSGDWADSLGLSGVLGVPVLLGRKEWVWILPAPLADDEADAMRRAVNAVTAVRTSAGR
jgi:malate dehydrogenase